MNRTPRTPPQIAMNVIIRNEGVATELSSAAHMNRAGRVNIAPAASDSPAEPMVCTMLFSRMEFFLRISLIIPIEITAAGIEAETVIPTRRPR